MVVHRFFKRLPLPGRLLTVTLFLSAALALLLAATCVGRERGVAPTAGSTALREPPTPRPTWTPVPTEACFTPVPVPTTEVRQLPDGGTEYIYDSNGSGVGDTFKFVPPPNFDPVTQAMLSWPNTGFNPDRQIRKPYKPGRRRLVDTTRMAMESARFLVFTLVQHLDDARSAH